MSEQQSNSGFITPPPSDDRRNKVGTPDEDRNIQFVERKISEERLNALRQFLKTATADDIATVRRMYGENLEVLRLIGIEMADDSDKNSDS